MRTALLRKDDRNLLLVVAITRWMQHLTSESAESEHREFVHAVLSKQRNDRAMGC